MEILVGVDIRRVVGFMAILIGNDRLDLPRTPVGSATEAYIH